MRNIILFFCTGFISVCMQAQTVNGPLGEVFSRRVVAGELSDPWEITMGPDNYLWITEARGYQVSRIDPVSGQKTVLLDVSNERQFPRYDKLVAESHGKPWLMEHMSDVM